MTQNKRPAERQDGGKRKRRGEWSAPRKGGATLKAGNRAVLATCVRGKERQAARELVHLFERQLAPAAQQPKEESATAAIEDEFASELAELKKPAAPRGFEAIDAGIGSFLLFRINDPEIEPAAFVTKLLHDLDASKEKATRFVQRIHPLSRVSFANMNDFTALAKTIVDRDLNALQFPAGAPKKKFACVVTMRNHNKLDKMEVIEMVARLPDKERFEVDLKNPDFVIVMEFFKLYAGISVVQDYYSLKRFNIQSIFEANMEGEKTEEKKEENKDLDPIVEEAATEPAPGKSES